MGCQQGFSWVSSGPGVIVLRICHRHPLGRVRSTVRNLRAMDRARILAVRLMSEADVVEFYIDRTTLSNSESRAIGCCFRPSCRRAKYSCGALIEIEDSAEAL